MTLGYLLLGNRINSDPLGLSHSDPFDEIDAIINEYVGARTGILSGLGQEAQATAIMAAQIASYLPFPGVGILGDLALVAMGEMTMEAALMGAAIGIIPGGKLVKMFMKNGGGKAIGNAMKGFGATAKNMVGSRLAKAGGWVARKAKKFVGKGCSSGCFAAATMVWTANGAVPIVEIEEGQQVLSAADDGLAEDYSSNEVGTKIIVGEASLVQLVLLHEDGSTETLNTTDEHPFHVVDTAAWTRADQLIIGDQLSTITGTATLQSVIYTTERVPVYNLSIPGSPTYYVGEHGVWVHNVSPFDCFPGLSEQWKKHAPGMADQLRKKAIGTPTGPPVGVFNKEVGEVMGIIAHKLEPGIAFQGNIPATQDLARVFMPGSGAEQAATSIFVRWDGKRLRNLYPAP